MEDFSRARVILVTGMSGAGRNFVLKTLEDVGYESVDNLPLSLLGLIVHQTEQVPHPLAIGIDVRTRDFSVERFIQHLEHLNTRADLKVEVIFCDCDDEILSRRYTETRRRHPLAGEERPVLEGIKAERKILAKIREKATFILDTTHLALTDARQILRQKFALETSPQVFIQVLSFSYRNGIPREADLVFDVRFLKNPYYIPELTNSNGEDTAVKEYINADPVFAPFIKHFQQLFLLMLPRYDEEGRGYFTIAFGCTGGRHRSVYCATYIAQWLKEDQKRLVGLRHRDTLIKKSSS